MTSYHVYQSVSGALKFWGHKEWKVVAKESGTTVAEIKERFRIWESEGIKVIPFGDACEGFTYETGCPGHDTVALREEK